MIDTEDLYFLTYLGKSELAAAGTSLSRSELELLVLIDGNTTVSQLQASAGHLAPSVVIEVLDKLLRSDYIALQQFDLGDFFGASAPAEWKGEMPSDSVIERGVSTLQQNGYVVRIARRPPSEPKFAQDRKLTVMVVEDEQQLAENIRTVLSFSGFVARVAANREQIVAAFRQPPRPDLVLLDVMLPDTNGFEVLAKMRQHPMLGEVPVIMVTGTATREAVLKGLLRGANGYITKPFEIDVLVKAVKAVLGIGGRKSEMSAVIQLNEPANPPAHTSVPTMNVAARNGGPAESQKAVSARAPGSLDTPTPKAFPTLFADDDLEATVQLETRKQAKVKTTAEYIAIVSQNYSRIATAIELTWGNIECETYMNQLVLNDRFDGQRFPKAVAEALLVLFERHKQEFDFGTSDDYWAIHSNL